MIKEIKRRHSPVLFKDKNISKAKLMRCLEAARWAPSCSNNQPWKFLLIEGPRRIGRLTNCFSRGNQWALKAPLVGFIVANPDDACITEENDNLQYFQYDCALAMMSFVIQGEAEGLKTHQMAGYKEKEVRKHFKIPKKYRVIVSFAMGYEELLKDYKYPLDERMVKKATKKKRIRKPLKEVYTLNKFE